MIFRLWHKLALTVIGITGIVLVLSLYISDLSVKKGFLSYINQVESNRLDGLKFNLIDGYQENGDWEFIRENKRLWHRYNQRSNSPLPGNSTEAPSTDTFSETENASQLKKILKDEDYLEIYKIILIVNKILPDDIDVDYYINLMFDKIKSDNSKLNFTKEYLIRRLNKDIDIDENKVRTLGTVCNTNTEIIDELFNKKSIIQEFYDKVYELIKP